jgi:hypothetical protein
LIKSSQKSSVSDAIRPQQLKQRKTKRGIEEERARVLMKVGNEK